MGHRLLLAAVAMLVLLLSGCSDDDERPPEATATRSAALARTLTVTPSATSTRLPTAVATPTATVAATPAPAAARPLTARTGLATVDVVLAAVEAADVRRLAGLLHHEQIACVSRQEGIGGPPLCDPGVAAGTRIEVFRAAQCEGFFASSAGAAQLLNGFLAGQLRIHSVVRAPAGPPSPNRIEYDFAIVFVDLDAPRRARALALRGAVIDRVFLGCNQTGEEITSVLFGDGTAVSLTR